MFDARRDLTQFVFSDQPGFLLNPSLTAYDTRKVGTIQGSSLCRSSPSAQEPAGPICR